jgi:hypothetical protein
MEKSRFEDFRTHKREKGEQDVVVSGDGGDASRLEGGHQLWTVELGRKRGKKNKVMLPWKTTVM